MDLLDVCRLLREACKQAGGQVEWARRHGVSKSYVGAVLNAECEPGQKILDALGLVRVVSYAPRRSRREAA